MISKILLVQHFFKNLQDSIISILKVIFFSKFSIKIPKNKNTFCSILGNGPSLKQTLEKDIDFIKNSEVFCLNHFSITDFYEIIKPQNYLLLDPAFINESHIPCQKTIDLLVEKTTWKINLFVPLNYLKSNFFINKIKKNPHISVIVFNYTITKGFDNLNYFFFKKNIGMPQCQNVMVATLFYAINMGFEKIYLFGGDHTWHEEISLDENNQLIGNHKHFYDDKTYYTHENMNQTGISYMSKQFLSLHKAFHGYEVLAKYALKQQVKIFNASKRSYIDVFEKIKL